MRFHGLPRGSTPAISDNIFFRDRSDRTFIEQSMNVHRTSKRRDFRVEKNPVLVEKNPVLVEKNLDFLEKNIDGIHLTIR